MNARSLAAWRVTCSWLSAALGAGLACGAAGVGGAPTQGLTTFPPRAVRLIWPDRSQLKHGETEVQRVGPDKDRSSGDKKPMLRP